MVSLEEFKKEEALAVLVPDKPIKQGSGIG